MTDSNKQLPGVITHASGTVFHLYIEHRIDFLVLVRFEDRQGKLLARSRFDIGKRHFIDPIPMEFEADGVNENTKELLVRRANDLEQSQETR